VPEEVGSGGAKGSPDALSLTRYSVEWLPAVCSKFLIGLVPVLASWGFSSFPHRPHRVKKEPFGAPVLLYSAPPSAFYRMIFLSEKEKATLREGSFSLPCAAPEETMRKPRVADTGTKPIKKFGTYSG
jgi:hypothetical protein